MAAGELDRLDLIVTRDPDGKALRSFGPKSYPSSLVIDASGIVRAVERGWGEGTARELGVEVLR